MGSEKTDETINPFNPSRRPADLSRLRFYGFFKRRSAVTPPRSEISRRWHSARRAPSRLVKVNFRNPLGSAANVPSISLREAAEIFITSRGELIAPRGISMCKPAPVRPTDEIFLFPPLRKDAKYFDILAFLRWHFYRHRAPLRRLPRTRFQTPRITRPTCAIFLP